MGMLSTLLMLPVAGPAAGIAWIARKIGEHAASELDDPNRIQAALLALEKRLEAGEIGEEAFEAEEAALLGELAEMRARRAGA